MDQCKGLLCPVLRLLWEGQSPLFPGQARITQLFRVLDRRESMHEPTACHPLHAVEVQMSKPCVPTLFFRNMTHGETHWKHRAECEPVQTVW
jgi:hypothetical protein